MDTENWYRDEWIGGNPGGSLKWYEKDRAYKVRFNLKDIQIYKAFSPSNYGNKMIALKEAIKYRREISDGLNMTKNKYRTVWNENDDEFLEVQLQGEYIAKIDSCDLKILKKCTWSTRPSSSCNRIYMGHSVRKNVKSELFHRLIYPEWKEVDHINRDGLDNRRCNLRDGKFQNTNVKNQAKRKDNTSGKTGVHFSNYSQEWTVQWPENGKRKHKSFSINKYGDEQAKQLAIKFRVELDERLGISNGYTSDCDDRKEEFPDINQPLVPEDNILEATNTSGITGVRFNGKAWVAYWTVNKKRGSQTFSIEIYGDEARELAIQKRLEMKPFRK